jgi:hypothetical protein
VMDAPFAQLRLHRFVQRIEAVEKR